MYGEFELIEKIAAMFPSHEGVTVGIGDDGAVLDPGRFDLVTTDTLVEGVHFDRRWSSARDIGWKALATNLSDIAAMGGGPGVFFLNLTLPRGERREFIDELLEGMREALEALVPKSFQLSCGGGDTTSTRGPLVISITLLGESSPAGPLLRQGAVPGDRIIVLGPLGLAAAGVALLGGETGLDIEAFPELLQAHRRPRPRIYEGAILGLYGVPSALLDVSDGFLQDLGHILRRSQVGAAVETHGMARDAQLVSFCEQSGQDLLELMLTGGDDYELLMTVPPARMPKLWELARRYEWDVYDIGEVRSASEGLRVLRGDGSLVALEGMKLGYQHQFEEEE